MIDFIATNWLEIIIAIAGVSAIIWGAINFIKNPKSEQIKKIKEWLLFAVTKAEIELGAGTGELKLSMVYDMFISKFPFMSTIISFEKFDVLVDLALQKMRKLLECNEDVARIIKGDF